MWSGTPAVPLPCRVRTTFANKRQADCFPTNRPKEIGDEQHPIPRRVALPAVVALVMLLSACTPSRADPYPDEEAFAELVLNALSVARPDYGFDPSPEAGRTDEGVRVTVTAYPIGTSMRNVYRIPVTVTFDRNTGAIHVSVLPETRLGRVLGVLGDGSPEADPQDVRDTRELLENMGRSVAGVAVAELAEPLEEAVALREGSDLGSPHRAILPFGRDPLPLGNSLYCRRTCAQQSFVASFQEWVSTLKPRDMPVLRAFGLNLEALREAAREGGIHGLVYENYDAGTLLTISRSPRVKALYLADVTLRCAPGSGDLCRPRGD